MPLSPMPSVPIPSPRPPRRGRPMTGAALLCLVAERLW